MKTLSEAKAVHAAVKQAGDVLIERTRRTYIITLEVMIKRYQRGMWITIKKYDPALRLGVGGSGHHQTVASHMVAELKSLAELNLQAAANVGFERALADLKLYGWLSDYTGPIYAPAAIYADATAENEKYLTDSLLPYIQKKLGQVETQDEVPATLAVIRSRVNQYGHWMWRTAEIAYRDGLKSFFNRNKRLGESLREVGGPGSGNFKHRGRKGYVGGSEKREDPLNTKEQLAAGFGARDPQRVKDEIDHAQDWFSRHENGAPTYGADKWANEILAGNKDTLNAAPRGYRDGGISASSMLWIIATLPPEERHDYIQKNKLYEFAPDAGLAIRQEDVDLPRVRNIVEQEIHASPLMPQTVGFFTTADRDPVGNGAVSDNMDVLAYVRYGSGNTLAINNDPKVWRRFENLPQYLPQLASDGEVPFNVAQWLPKGQREEGTITHEMGHILNAQMSADQQSKWLKLAKDMDRGNISQYARTNPNEAFAEAYTSYRYGLGRTDTEVDNFFSRTLKIKRLKESDSTASSITFTQATFKHTPHADYVCNMMADHALHESLREADDDMSSVGALFVGPDDADTCNGCEGAVNGNPYTLDDVPTPGEFECMTRCRHMVQLTEESDDVPTTEWSASLGFGPNPPSKYYADVTPDDQIPTAAETTPSYDATMDDLLDAYTDNANLTKSDDTELLSQSIADVIATIGDAEPAEIAQTLADAGLTPDDVRDLLGLSTAEYAELATEFDAITGYLDENYARLLLADANVEELQALIDENAEFKTLLNQIGEVGFDDADADQAEALARTLNTSTYIASDGRWYLQGLGALRESFVEVGTSSSGNHGHAGRPGKRGGSVKRSELVVARDLENEVGKTYAMGSPGFSIVAEHADAPLKELVQMRVEQSLKFPGMPKQLDAIRYASTLNTPGGPFVGYAAFTVNTKNSTLVVCPVPTSGAGNWWETRVKNTFSVPSSIAYNERDFLIYGVDHEMGHVLENHLDFTERGSVGVPDPKWTFLYNAFKADAVDIRKPVGFTQYGATSEKELFAESYCAYINKPDLLPSDIRVYFDSLKAMNTSRVREANSNSKVVSISIDDFSAVDGGRTLVFVDGKLQNSDLTESEDEPRDDHGRWTTGGGSVKGVDELRGKGDDLDRYFTFDPAAQHLPIEQVYSTKDETADPKFKAGLKRDPRERAAEAMLASYKGEGDKRKPINVEKMDDGRYHITDGNATYQVAKMAGWSHVRAIVSEATKEVGTASSGDYGHAGNPGHVGGSVSSGATVEENHGHAGRPGQVGGSSGGDAYSALVDEAKSAVERAEPRQAKLLADLTAVFGADAVSGRVKSLKSIVEKVENEGDRRPNELWDVIGARVTVKNYNNAENVANYIREHFNPTREKDMNSDPKPDGYHAIHFNVDLDGQSAEIQVRTPNQTKWSDWAHEQIYKPHADEPERAAAIKENMPVIREYSLQAARYYASIDSGRDDGAKMPPCTHVIKITVGCLE